jgi:hypothetical protein
LGVKVEAERGVWSSLAPLQLNFLNYGIKQQQRRLASCEARVQAETTAAAAAAAPEGGGGGGSGGGWLGGKRNVREAMKRS